MSNETPPTPESQEPQETASTPNPSVLALSPDGEWLVRFPDGTFMTPEALVHGYVKLQLEGEKLRREVKEMSLVRMADGSLKTVTQILREFAAAERDNRLMREGLEAVRNGTYPNASN